MAQRKDVLIQLTHTGAVDQNHRSTFANLFKHVRTVHFMTIVMSLSIFMMCLYLTTNRQAEQSLVPAGINVNEDVTLGLSNAEEGDQGKSNGSMDDTRYAGW